MTGDEVLTTLGIWRLFFKGMGTTQIASYFGTREYVVANRMNQTRGGTAWKSAKRMRDDSR